MIGDWIHTETQMRYTTLDVDLVQPGRLKVYEECITANVSRIAENLASSGVLLNPIVADRDLQLLIDGQHRARAIHCLGLTWVPVYWAEYFSDDVSVAACRYVAHNVELSYVSKLTRTGIVDARDCMNLSEDCEGRSRGRTGKISRG